MIVLATSGAAAAGPVFPAVVTVVGASGASRVVIYSGFDVPNGRREPASCDEGDRRHVDRMLEPGARVTFTSPAPCLCVQHSVGTFRRTELTKPRFACASRDIYGRYYGAIDIAIAR